MLERGVCRNYGRCFGEAVTLVNWNSNGLVKLLLFDVKQCSAAYKEFDLGPKYFPQLFKYEFFGQERVACAPKTAIEVALTVPGCRSCQDMFLIALAVILIRQPVARPRHES